MKLTTYKKLNSNFKHIFLFLIGIFLFIIIWEIIAFSTSQKFVPEFFSTLSSSFQLFGDLTFYEALGRTLLNLLISISVSFVLGVTLGTLGGYFETFGRILSPIVTIIRSFPTIAIVFLLVIFVPHFSWYVVGLVLFPVIYQSTHDGTEDIFQKYKYQILIDGKYHINKLVKVIIPLNINYILLGLVQAFGLGLKVEIMAETFSYTVGQLGLGNYIQLYYQSVQYQQMMSYVLIAVMLSLLIDGITLIIKNKIKQKIY